MTRQTWTNDAPTEPGYYWYRHGPDRVAEIVNLEVCANDLRTVNDLERFWHGTPATQLSGQWLGPIRQPK